MKTITIEKKPEHNVIVGMSHFIKTIRDIPAALKKAVPDVKFGMAFCEASGKRLIRKAGTSDELIDLAVKNAQAIGAGHSFIIILDGTFPIQVLNELKRVEEICTIYCATANPLKVLIMEEDDQRGIIGVLDGQIPLGVETEKDVQEREKLLKKLGY
jgi:uncharacterized protein